MSIETDPHHVGERALVIVETREVWRLYLKLLNERDVAALWDQHDGQRVRPPGHPETHGVVYMVDVWTVWAEAERIAREAEQRLGVVLNKPSDAEHARNIRAAACQVYKYGRPEIDLRDAVDWAIESIRVNQRFGRTQWLQHSRLPYIWSPNHLAAALTAWRNRPKQTAHDGPRREWT